MAGKRKSIQQGTDRKTSSTKKKTEDSRFTKEEEEEPLSVHIQPSPKKSRCSNNHVGDDTCKEEDKPDDNDVRKESPMATDVGNDEREEERKKKYEVRQRVLARDEDGILYYANVRRKLYGFNHQKTISVLGIFDLAPEELIENKKKIDNNDKNNNDSNKSHTNNENEWLYFVHYEGWKTLWDRWVLESDILEITPENLERMKEISKTHKAFQLEYKENTKKRKIQNGGLFLQQWKQRLDALNRRWDDKLHQTDCNEGKGVNADGKKKVDKPSVANKRKKTAKKKNDRSPQEILRDRSKLAVQSCLAIRQPSHIQAIPLSFGLKRILVEDWENLNNSNFKTDSIRNDAADENLNRDMVHVLPAKVTIRDALSLYLKEKGISWNGKTKHQSRNNTGNGLEADCVNEVSSKINPPSKVDQESSPTTHNEQTRSDSSNMKDPSKISIDASQSVSSPIPEKTPSIEEENSIILNGNDDNGKGISIQLVKEWTDMADGIVLYFEQALMTRLLYPSEISQILFLEESITHANDSESSNKVESRPLKVDIYGCEHLLRLLAAIPRILDQQLQELRKRKLERKSSSTVLKRKASAETDEDAAALDQDDAFVEIGSMILAKLQDLSRFLQKNQSSLFQSMYRKKNDHEIKRDIKIQKRQERRLKSAASAAVASLTNLKDSEVQ